MKNLKKFVTVLLSALFILSFTPTSFAQANECDLMASNAAAVDALINNVLESDFSSASLELLQDKAKVQISQLDQYTTQYTVVENSPIYSTDNSSIYRTTTLLNVEYSTSQTVYNGSVKLKAELFYEEVDINGQSGYRIIQGSGTVISNSEQYGRNLYIKLKATGAYGTTSGSRGIATEGWYTAYSQYPSIGTTYYNNSSFAQRYYFAPKT